MQGFPVGPDRELCDLAGGWVEFPVTRDAASLRLKSGGTDWKWLLTSCCCSPIVWKNNALASNVHIEKGDLPVRRGNFGLDNFESSSFLQLA